MRILSLIFYFLSISASADDYSLATNPEFRKTFEETKIKADQGNADAQYNLGVYYASGVGVSESDTEAVRLYRMAAEQGHAEAQHILASCYWLGKGVIKNYPEAVKWWRIAAEQGNANAQGSLGSCYEEGEGVTKNLVEAYAYYNLASAHSLRFAIDKRVELEKKMNSDQIKEGQMRSQELLSEINGDKSGIIVERLTSIISSIRRYSDVIIFVICTLFVGASYTLIKEKLTKSSRGKTRRVEDKTMGSSYTRPKGNKFTYFKCWWKTTLMLLLFQGLLGYLNSGTQGMAIMLGRGIILSPLHALWIAWIWWSIKK